MAGNLKQSDRCITSVKGTIGLKPLKYNNIGGGSIVRSKPFYQILTSVIILFDKMCKKIFFLASELQVI